MTCAEYADARALNQLGVIDSQYDYTPVGFTNGSLENAPGENVGSCKLVCLVCRSSALWNLVTPRLLAIPCAAVLGADARFEQR